MMFQTFLHDQKALLKLDYAVRSKVIKSKRIRVGITDISGNGNKEVM